MYAPAGLEVYPESCAELKRIREEGLRDSERVVDIWCACISQYTHRLGDEKWALYEQVFVSALDCGRLDVAEACLSQLVAQFPGSVRIQRYQAMRLEAEGRLDDAAKMYKELTDKDKLDAQARKRLVAVLKSRGRTVEAIKSLTVYLQDFCTDFEAWLELSELYLNEGDYKKAAFCLEELILSNPHHHVYHQRYAEIKYTEGGADAMELAKSYFAQAARLNPANMRALYGLLLAAGNCAAAAATGKASASRDPSVAKSRRESARLAQWAAARIAERYRAVNGGGPGCNGDVLEGLTAQLSLLSTAANCEQPLPQPATPSGPPML